MLISLIIPAYNEEKNILKLYQELKKTLSELEHDHELIFINDGSQDNTQDELDRLSQNDPGIKVIEFTRNFGKEIATTAGLNSCNGQVAIMIDADLQHPVEIIPQFIEKWQAGHMLVIGVRKKDQAEGIIKKIGTYFFYKLINIISEVKVKAHSTDFRLLDRQVINEFNRLSERNRMTRGLINWLGFKPTYIYFQPNQRFQGKARYSTLKLIKLALSSMVSLSLFPLKLAGYLGIFITFFSGLGGLFIFIEKYILKDPWNLSFSGPAILAVINLFLIGIVLSCLGLIALYIANIHNEVIDRPIYVIKKKINLT